MRLCLLFFVISLLGYACGGATTTSSTSATEPAAKGAKIYKQYCVACHGLDGKMQINGAKDLTASTLSLEERIAIVTNGKTSEAGVMTPFKGMISEEGIEQVATYIETLRK